jgi:hypothetical protein
LASTAEGSDLDRRIKELEAQLKEQELRDKKSSRALLAQSFLTSLPIVLTVGLGFLANYIQSKSQHETEMQTLQVQSGIDRQKQLTALSDAESARREEAKKSLMLQSLDAKAKLEQQEREFVANAQMAQSRFAQEQRTLNAQHAAEQRRQSTEFSQSLERQRRQNEADLLLQVIKVGDLAVARANIGFLLQAGLVRDTDGRIALAAKERPPVLPTASGALEVSVPDSGSAQGQALVQRLQGAGTSSGSAPRHDALTSLIDAISRERAKYSVRELAVMLALIEDETGGAFRPMPERCSAQEVRMFGRGNPPPNLTPEQCFEMLYGGRIGNTQPGDGFRFRGRGYIMIIGRSNYQRLSRQLGADLVANPDLLSEPVTAFRAVLLLSEQGLAQLRQRPDFAVDDPAKFPFEEAVRPLIRSIVGPIMTRAPKIAARARSIEGLLRESLSPQR